MAVLEQVDLEGHVIGDGGRPGAPVDQERDAGAVAAGHEAYRHVDQHLELRPDNRVNSSQCVHVRQLRLEVGHRPRSALGGQLGRPLLYPGDAQRHAPSGQARLLRRHLSALPSNGRFAHPGAALIEHPPHPQGASDAPHLTSPNRAVLLQVADGQFQLGR